jgi:hypothetical protein
LSQDADLKIPEEEQEVMHLLRKYLNSKPKELKGGRKGKRGDLEHSLKGKVSLNWENFGSRFHRFREKKIKCLESRRRASGFLFLGTTSSGWSKKCTPFPSLLDKFQQSGKDEARELQWWIVLIVSQYLALKSKTLAAIFSGMIRRIVRACRREGFFLLFLSGHFARRL